MRATTLSTTSMILYDDMDNPHALIVEQTDSSLDVYFEDKISSYKDMDELQRGVGEFKVHQRSENKSVVLGGYPVAVDEVFSVEDVDTVPSYTKSDKSKIRYAAGYYGIMFSDQYVPAFCPKVSTLAKYTTMGPFSEVITLRSELLLANKSIKK